MTSRRTLAAVLVAASLLLAACDSATTLPLQRGFYVASDTACADASNATLLLLRRDGIGGARDFCAFTRVTATGPASYRVEEECGDFQGSERESRLVDYVLDGDRRFIATDAYAQVLDARFCEQSALPADWQDVDISADIQ